VQYYWAEPRLFLSEKNYWANSVNIALTEVHGNWGEFNTVKGGSNADRVFLTAVGKSGGYGAGAGGALAHWIIHSCEVMPMQTDESNSFDVWWDIFNGLHLVVGYRTEMYIDDDVIINFAYNIGRGAPTIGAWFNEIASNNHYGGSDTYFDGNRGINEPWGRASSVSVCGHTDDTAYNVGPIEKPGCLYEYWFQN